MRAFIALPLPTPARNVAIDALAHVARWAAKSGVSLKEARPEQLHVTLKFLGSVEREHLPQLEAAVAAAAASHAPILVEVGPLELFGPPRRASVALLAVSDRRGLLAALASELERAVLPRGMPSDPRRFVPHVTLARFRAPTDATTLLRAVPAETHPACFEEIELCESTPTPSGSRYTSLYRARLGG